MFWRSPAGKSKQQEIPASAAPDVEARTQQIGRELLAATRSAQAGALSAKFWSDKLIITALEDERFKTELFRFVDVFPVLKDPAQIHQHLVEYLQQPGVRAPAAMAVALKAGGVLKGTLARTVASQIEQMAGNFIAGRDLASALPTLKERWSENITFSVDLLGEACVSHAEAQAYSARYLKIIQELPALAAQWPASDLLERDHLGSIPRVNVSIKISAIDGHVSPVDAAGSLDRLTSALAPLLQTAAKNRVLINFDMEQSSLKELTIRLFKRCCEKFDFDAGLALQAYLRTADADVRDLVEWTKSRGRLITVRLIKGAYWDYETIYAELMNWPAPVWPKKSETDACFERITSYLISQTPRDAKVGGVKLALGTHNIRSVAHAMAQLEHAGLPQNAIEFQCLRGMAEELKSTLADQHWRVREYMPIGEMIPGMAYLVRRLLENTSNEGWLRAGHASNAADDQLLAPPSGAMLSGAGAPLNMPNADKPSDLNTSFTNEPMRDFSQQSVRDTFRDALQKAHVPPIANDSTEASASTAITRAQAAFPAWRDTPPLRRAQIILDAAQILRQNRDSLAAAMILESSKTWHEADGDICEAIDFCEYYARQSLPLFTPHPPGPAHFTGELNQLFHQPRGIAAIIAPWNFPLAICTGMTVAALVTGNAAIVKPAEQTPAIAKKLCEALWQAGIPRDILHFLPGQGEIVGAALVRDPRIALIAFTGSKAVGLQIIRAAAETPPEQHFVKRVICEMGGKNAIIIDDSADLDEAVLGVRQSAFGFAGQKCSAASRIIVLDSIHDAFVARLVESTKSLIVGDPRDPATDLGPVIDDEAAAKIRQYIEIGKREAIPVGPPSDMAPFQVGPQSSLDPSPNATPSSTRLIPPHIFINVLPTHRIAREEIFGPVLSILRAKDFTHALELANDSPYKLTGGLYSRTPSHLEQAKAEFRVGNLYLNRGITGALVSRQPFGGFGLSGVGSKAGGPEYLLQFTDPRSTTENTLRRGFAPELKS